jgi:WD40 repeat protein
MLVLLALVTVIPAQADPTPITPADARRVIGLETWTVDTPLWSLALSPDAMLAAAGGRERNGDYTIYRWDAASGDALAPLEAHTGQVRALQFDSTGARLLSGGLDGQALLWDVADEVIIAEWPGDPVWSAAISPDDAWIALGRGTTVGNTGRNRVELIEIESGEIVHSIALPDNIWPPFAVTFSADSTRFASGGVAADVLAWDVETGEAVAAYPLAEDANVPIFAAQYNADTLAAVIGFVAPAGTVIYAIDPATGSFREFIGHGRLVNALRFNPAGDLLWTSAEDGELRLWDVAAGETLITLQHGAAASTVAAGETLLVSAGPDGTIRTWGLPG